MVFQLWIGNKYQIKTFGSVGPSHLGFSSIDYGAPCSGRFKHHYRMDEGEELSSGGCLGMMEGPYWRAQKAFSENYFRSCI